MTKRLLVALLCLCAFASPGRADERAVDVILPTGADAPTDPDVSKLRWYKYDTKNFTVLSTDRQQGVYLEANVEKMKTWAYARWGMKDQAFSRECRLMCVPDRPTFKKLFSLDESAVEGREKISGVWLVLDDRPSRTVPGMLTEICLQEYELASTGKLGWWVHRGMARLNGNLGDVRADVAALQPLLNTEVIWPAKSVLTIGDKDYARMTPDRRATFDRQAAAMLLLVRQEYGAVKFKQFALATGDPETALRAALGFRDYQHFGGAYKKYLADLTGDVAKGLTPDAYLDIGENNR